MDGVFGYDWGNNKGNSNMATMLKKCALCLQEKGPDLMRSNDTCHECAERQRLCQKCINGTVAKSWRDGACPLCGHKAEASSLAVEAEASSLAVEAEVKHNPSKPEIISMLSLLGWILFAMSVWGGNIIYRDGDGVLGVSLLIAGVFQLSIFLGFSAIIDQLYKINVNTAKSDKSDS
jgi:hypothetical protein